MRMRMRMMTAYSSSSSIAPLVRNISQNATLLRRSLASAATTTRRGEPRIKIPAQVFVFSLMLLPVAGFAMYAQRYGPEEEELEEEIRQRYGADIAKQHSNNKAMQELFQHAIKNPNDGVADDRLSQVLYGGRGEMKRLHAIDKDLYGTAHGVEEKKRVQQELQQEAEERKKRRRKRRKQQGKEPDGAIEIAAAAAAAENSKKQEESADAKNETKRTTMLKIDATQVATIAVVGTIAALAGFLAGGRRN